MKTCFQHRASRRGITLTEVLISMFVLLIGLMGVGAMIPAGRYEIMQGVKADYAAMVGREAYRDMKVRGWLDPTNWVDQTGTAVVLNPSSPGWAIDPLGLWAQSPTPSPAFPLGSFAPNLQRIFPNQGVYNNRLLANSLFRCSDDLTLVASTLGRDRPPVQQSIPYNQDPLNPINPILARSSEGNYSWLATITPDPTALPLISGKMTVAIAVFYKRDLSNPATVEAAVPCSLPVPGIWTGELFVYMPGTKSLRPGNWIMLAGQVNNPAPTPVPPQFNYFRWYRVQGAAAPDSRNQQSITLHGGDWNPAAINVSAWMFDNVIGVYEKSIRLEWN